MNRYAINGLVQDMRKGRRIAAVYGTHRDAREAMELVWSRASDAPGTRVRRTNGCERVEDLNSGGRIRFLSARGNGYRGLSADILYFDTPVSDDLREMLIPIICASPHAEVLAR